MSSNSSTKPKKNYNRWDFYASFSGCSIFGTFSAFALSGSTPGTGKSIGALLILVVLFSLAIRALIRRHRDVQQTKFQHILFLTLSILTALCFILSVGGSLTGVVGLILVNILGGIPKSKPSEQHSPSASARVLKFQCPHCKDSVQTELSFMGTVAPCPHCSIDIEIPVIQG